MDAGGSAGASTVFLKMSNSVQMKVSMEGNSICWVQSRSPPHFLPVGLGTEGCDAPSLARPVLREIIPGAAFTPQPLGTGTGQGDLERSIEIHRDRREEGLWLPPGKVSALGLVWLLGV